MALAAERFVPPLAGCIPVHFPMVFKPQVKYTRVSLPSSREVECSVCLGSNASGDDWVAFPVCGHLFHEGCLTKWLSVSQTRCPNCRFDGAPTHGLQPSGGSFVVCPSRAPWPGAPSQQSLEIHIEHVWEHPTHKMRAVLRATTFLPASAQGRELCRMLREAWTRRLLYLVVQVRPGVCRMEWNGVHLKTRRWGGPANNGFPDPGYMVLLMLWLRALGVHSR